MYQNLFQIIFLGMKEMDNHFKNLEITNFDMTYNNKTLSNGKIKQY